MEKEKYTPKVGDVVLSRYYPSLHRHPHFPTIEIDGITYIEATIVSINNDNHHSPRITIYSKLLEEAKLGHSGNIPGKTYGHWNVDEDLIKLYVRQDSLLDKIFKE